MVKFEMSANRINEIQINGASPEKAGVGGSIPSLATIPFDSHVSQGCARAFERSEAVSPATLCQAIQAFELRSR